MDNKHILRRVRSSAVGPILNFPRRFIANFPTAAAPAINFGKWLFTSREDTNFTYGLTRSNMRHLAHMISIVTGKPSQQALDFIDEANSDQELRQHIISRMQSGPDRYYSDARADFAKRLGWYALVRIAKPELVVETGVDKGLGAVVIASALLKNGKGRYLGTDIDPTAGRLLSGKYAQVGTVLYGDSITSLGNLAEKIDIFINDSDHSAEYEAREYQVIEGKLSDGAFVIGDNAHATDMLMEWSERKNRNFLFWREQPLSHWYPGAGIGISFP